jgi:hypothetical protein
VLPTMDFFIPVTSVMFQLKFKMSFNSTNVFKGENKRNNRKLFARKFENYIFKLKYDVSFLLKVVLNSEKRQTNH